MSPALRADLPAEEQWVGDSAGIATRMSWAPDRMAVRVHAPTEGVLRINQNFHPGWRADRGRVFSDDGLLAVALPAGDHVVHLSFLPRSGFGGLAVSVTTLVAMVALTLLSRRRGGPTTVLARPAWIALLGPLGVLTLVLVFVREPAPRRPVPTSPSGAPLLAAPPAAAAAIAAGHPIAIDPSHALDLAGAEAAPADKALGEGLLRVTLWWRRTGALVKTPWRVRVILRNDEGLLLQQNHELVSSWLPLHKLPLDTYVRDEIFFPLPPAEKSPSATSPAELLLELEDAQGATISAGREPLLTGVPLP